MARRELVGMGRVVLANRERPIILEPMGRGIRAFTLHYAHEVRSEADYFADIAPLELPRDLLDVTAMILDSKKGDFDPAYLEDRYRTVLVEKLKEKQSKLPLRQPSSRPSAQNVINLMDALKASLATAKPPAPSKSRAPGKRPAATKSTRGRGVARG
jgi:DNA end-binding protein Ku